MRLVQRLGNSVGNSHGAVALILDRLLSGRTYPKLAPITRVMRCRRSLLLAGAVAVTSLLSTRRWPPGSDPTRALQGMARVRSGQAPAWPLSSDRSVRSGLQGQA
jgi:hypothetical protein